MRLSLLISFILIILWANSIESRKQSNQYDETDELLKELEDKIKETDEELDQEVKESSNKKSSPLNPIISTTQSSSFSPKKTIPTTTESLHLANETENSNSWTVFFILCILGMNF